MDSNDYRILLNNEYKSRTLSAEDFNDTLMYFAKLYSKEKSYDKVFDIITDLLRGDLTKDEAIKLILK